MMLKILFVGLGGLSGAIARYLLSTWIKVRFQSSLPYGTLVVNLVGCFLFGLIFYGLERKQGLAPHIKELILIGFLGSFTTFSTFGFDTLELFEKGRVLLAMTNIVGHLLLGIGAVYVGRLVVQWWP